jgi:hypothetical protein
MRKTIIYLTLLVFCSCSSKGPNNKYVGHIPAIIELNSQDYQKFEKSTNKHKYDKGSYLNSRQPKFNEMKYKEWEKLKGVKMPCTSGNPDVFSVIDEVAVFDGRQYNITVEFLKGMKWVMLSSNICFFNSDTKKAYGNKLQFFSYSTTSYKAGDKIDVGFTLDDIRFEDAVDFQKNVDIAVIFLNNEDKIIYE